ncbi:plasminogen receptor (KT)-like [Hyposmocoma kahamanoa]|uniref:plasminogen receptor (KT)-like n=1 Tax=Hyposmocoma kahamanoa TaxID=1477025 RepID=UPI000E6D965A|nr:plasminogen receptor (KT)-like [Hyposmocoma kahamanoa]
MGNYFNRSMKKNQELMMEKQQQLQNQMRERQVAMAIAGSRDVCLWLTTFYVTAGAAMLNGYRKTKKPALLVPLFPLTFVTLYYWDFAYGNKIHRIRKEAEHIMTNEVELLGLPFGLPSLTSVDLGRIEDEDKKKNNTLSQ